MKHILIYPHTRNLFAKNEFKPFVKKYFKDIKFLGTESGNYYPMLEVSNHKEVENNLPKHAKPIKIIAL